MPDYGRRGARDSGLILDVNGVMQEAIGDEGLSRAEVDALAARAREITETLQARRGAGELPFYDLPGRKEMLKGVTDLAASVRDACDTLVVLGIGGSALGTRAVLDALGTDRVRVRVADNIDPWSFGQLLDGLDLQRCVFNVISKSRQTAETMAQFLIVRDRLLRTLGAVDYKEHVVITTDAQEGNLRQIVNDEGFRSLVVPEGVGGRFSVLTPVGLFPAAVAGVSIKDLAAGAAAMDARVQSPALWENPAHLLAALLYLAETTRGRNIVVLMPYTDRLRELASWFAQLWAESLGKAPDGEGCAASVGQTPVAAHGATDQHSQLQLYLDGPRDKVLIFIRAEDHGREIEIPTAYADLDGVSYLGGNGLGALLNMEQRATELALQRKRRMVMTLTLPEISAFTLGQLFFLFEAAVAFAGGLHGVNAFDQPGVEEGKAPRYKV